MDILEGILLKNQEFVENTVHNFESIQQDAEKYLKEVDRFLETKTIDFFKPECSGKENIEPNKRKGRPRKPALANVTEENILEIQTHNIKIEKISDIHKKQDEVDLNVQVKKEATDMPAPTRLPPRKKKIKTEFLEVPSRSTRSKARKQENHESIRESKAKNSDVIIQNTTITTIEISDNEKESESDNPENLEAETNMRSTRSKLKKINKCEAIDGSVSKLIRNESDDEAYRPVRSTRTKTKQKKRTRSNSPNQSTNQTKREKSNANRERESEYQDAVSVLEDNQEKPQLTDITYIASTNKPQDDAKSGASTLNSTMIVTNPKIVTHETASEIFSEKDSDVVPTTPPRPTPKSKKQIFSPFEKTPLKKKIEAFEKLGASSTGISTKSTGTKKKVLSKDPEHKKGNLSDEKNKSLEKDTYRTKMHTPMAPTFNPKVCSTSKLNKLHPLSNNTSTSNDSLLSVKSASALKASQAEFREREKRRQEKEKEALRKREALLQAQTEEKRRKREEKQQKAQQQREIIEKEKLKFLEMQKIKEEKFKQVMAEREEKLLKQKEEAEKRRLKTKKKADELLKEKEEEMRIAEQKQFAGMKALLDKQGEMIKTAIKHRSEAKQYPIYMTTRPPLLPTDDCYDSDDPEYKKYKYVGPAWQEDKEFNDTLLTLNTIGETIKNTFFCVQAQTPDLQEIFEIINPRKLKRTSSAVWRKPPRYTLMPVLEDTIEFSEDSE